MNESCVVVVAVSCDIKRLLKGFHEMVVANFSLNNLISFLLMS